MGKAQSRLHKLDVHEWSLAQGHDLLQHEYGLQARYRQLRGLQHKGSKGGVRNVKSVAWKHTSGKMSEGVKGRCFVVPFHVHGWSKAYYFVSCTMDLAMITVFECYKRKSLPQGHCRLVLVVQILSGFLGSNGVVIELRKYPWILKYRSHQEFGYYS